MDTWDILSFSQQIEHLVTFGILLVPVLWFLLGVLIELVEMYFSWVLEREIRFGSQSWHSLSTHLNDEAMFGWLFGGALASFALSLVLFLDHKINEDYGFAPLTTVVLPIVVVVSGSFALRYSARLVRWVGRIAKVAHGHEEDGVDVPLPDNKPTFK